MAAVFAHRLAEIGAAVEAALDEVLSLSPKAGEIARPERLIAAMRWGALGGGKRLRPFLMIETARALGLEGDAPLRAGVAIECLHNYSLIHDDLPAMDDDDLRRGRPTAHRQFDEATAILAGDGLLTLAFEILADPATHRRRNARQTLLGPGPRRRDRRHGRRPDARHRRRVRQAPLGPDDISRCSG